MVIELLSQFHRLNKIYRLLTPIILRHGLYSPFQGVVSTPITCLLPTPRLSLHDIYIYHGLYVGSVLIKANKLWDIRIKCFLYGLRHEKCIAEACNTFLPALKEENILS
jgi:hypothetical protein